MWKIGIMQQIAFGIPEHSDPDSPELATVPLWFVQKLTYPQGKEDLILQYRDPIPPNSLPIINNQKSEYKWHNAVQTLNNQQHKAMAFDTRTYRGYKSGLRMGAYLELSNKSIIRTQGKVLDNPSFLLEGTFQTMLEADETQTKENSLAVLKGQN